MLAAVIPFGLVAGAAPAAAGFGVWPAIGMSTIIFAGASQLALTDILAGGGSAIVAAMAAWTINMRMLLYSASLAPHLAHEPLRRRMLAAYLTVDQNYALSVSHWANKSQTDQSHPADARYLIGGGLFLGVTWVTCTIIGAFAGNTLPEELPLDFAVPLVFLVLLVPILISRPAFAAAAVGGGVAVGTAQLGFGPASIMAGALSGIAAGTLVDWLGTGSAIAHENATDGDATDGDSSDE